MTDNMFDKFVRDKLADHQSPVPPGLWDKIGQKKDKDPKGGFFLSRFSIWAGALIIAAGIGIGYYASTNNDNTDLSSSKEAVQKTTVAAKDDGTNTINTTPTTIPENTPEENQVNSSSPEIKDNNSIASISTNIPRRNNNIPAGSFERSENSDVKRNTTNVNELPLEKAVAKPVRQSDNTTYDITRNSATDGNDQNLTPVNGIIADRNNDWKRKSVRRKNDPFTQPMVSKSNAGINASTQEENVYNKLQLTSGKTAYNLRSMAKEDVKNFNLSDLKIPSIDCPPNGRMKRNDWYLEVYGSPDIVMKSVKANGNASFVSKKDSTESQQLSFTAGFRISKSIAEHLLLKTGLQYSQINERFDLRTENERRIITVVTIRTVIGSNGADSTISDTSTVEQIGYRLQRTYNRYRSIDIPLLLSYEFGNDNLKFAVNAGAIINLYSWYSGNTISDSSLAVVPMGSKGSGIYKHNIGVGLYAGFSIIKPISGKFDVFAEPYFRYNFSNMSGSASYSQRFNAMGINLGIRYKLKGRQRSGLD